MSNKLPSGPFSCVLADPPWSYGDKGFGKRANDLSVKGSFAPEAGRYSTMNLSDIKSLPVKEVTAKDCALFLWATSPLLPEAFEVISAWGFKYKTVAFCWSKTTSTGKEVANLGQWTMGNIELCLLATRGSPPRLIRTVRQLIVAQRREHSRKPVECYERVEALISGPRLEMFARERRLGWESWGNEVPS